MRVGALKGSALLLLFLVATPGLRAGETGTTSADATPPRAVFSLELFVQHRRVVRISAACALVAGFTCVALSIAGLTADCAAFVAEAAPASALRRDIIAFSASTALLSLSAAIFGSLAEPEAILSTGQ